MTTDKAFDFDLPKNESTRQLASDIAYDIFARPLPGDPETLAETIEQFLSDHELYIPIPQEPDDFCAIAGDCNNCPHPNSCICTHHAPQNFVSTEVSAGEGGPPIPCAHCGSTATAMQSDGRWWIECDECGIQTPTDNFGDPLKRWNTRVSTAKDEVIALRSGLEKIRNDYASDCLCEHGEDTCCAKVNEPCAKCDADAAIARADEIKGTK